MLATLLILGLFLAVRTEDSSRWSIEDRIGKRGSAAGSFNIPYAVSSTPSGDIVVAVGATGFEPTIPRLRRAGRGSHVRAPPCAGHRK